MKEYKVNRKEWGVKENSHGDGIAREEDGLEGGGGWLR